MTEKISKYKNELKQLQEHSKESERKAKIEQAKVRQLNEGIWVCNFLKSEIWAILT